MTQLSSELYQNELRDRYAREPRMPVLPDVPLGALTVRVQAIRYAAFTAARYRSAFSEIVRTGLAPPAGY
jgi:hypothetical protein